jgi:hypothetical protein
VAVLETFVAPQPPDVAASIPFPADVSLRPKVVRDREDPPLEIVPTGFKVREAVGSRSASEVLKIAEIGSASPQLGLPVGSFKYRRKSDAYPLILSPTEGSFSILKR